MEKKRPSQVEKEYDGVETEFSTSEDRAESLVPARDTGVSEDMEVLGATESEVQENDTEISPEWEETRKEEERALRRGHPRDEVA